MMKRYEVYKRIKGIEEYFRSWDQVNVAALTEVLKQDIYQKYVVKCKVFQRDQFRCQNTVCRYPDAMLTMHHVRWKKNGGYDKVRNGVTLCRTCHAGYHKARLSLVFADDSQLPSNIRGHTFQLSKADIKVNWKKIRIEMKSFRKRLKQSGVRPVFSWAQVAVMMNWLLGYSVDDEYDD